MHKPGFSTDSEGRLAAPLLRVFGRLHRRSQCGLTVLHRAVCNIAKRKNAILSDMTKGISENGEIYHLFPCALRFYMV